MAKPRKEITASFIRQKAPHSILVMTLRTFVSTLNKMSMQQKTYRLDHALYLNITNQQLCHCERSLPKKPFGERSAAISF
ncbi:MAG TPA: hypothetical protein VJ964_03895, partial [Balneolaceae bacterium]|nr:hypothetical protein [Balneolaceae bacterium]